MRISVFSQDAPIFLDLLSYFLLTVTAKCAPQLVSKSFQQGYKIKFLEIAQELRSPGSCNGESHFLSHFNDQNQQQPSVYAVVISDEIITSEETRVCFLPQHAEIKGEIIFDFLPCNKGMKGHCSLKSFIPEKIVFRIQLASLNENNICGWLSEHIIHNSDFLMGKKISCYDIVSNILKCPTQT